MQVLFLFGAGASKYAGGVAPASPPDGKGLFEALTQHDSFFRDKVDPNIAQAFREKFEKGMEELVAKQGEYVTMFLIKMSQYFLQFHIVDCSENLYVRLFELLRNKDFRSQR
jgi:hypothetical protein